MKRVRTERVGERRVMTNGLYATIIAYRLARDIDVQFDNGGRVLNRHYNDFIRGKIACPTLAECIDDYAIILNPNKSFEFLCDLEDVDRLVGYTWNDSHGYAYNTKLGFVHRHIMSAPGDLQIDHINHNITDNRKCNLRLCTIAENQRNTGMRRENTSGYKGVIWAKAESKWVAKIRAGGNSICLGYFADKIDAAKAYNEAAIKHHGEFARLNEI